jgi:hypothetical protein
MPTIQEFWNKLNANEKLVGYGAITVAVAFLIGLVGGSFGYGSTDLIAAIVIMAIYWLKYSPNQIKWPAPVPTIVLVIAGISAILALLGLLPALAFFGSLFGIAGILNAIGCGVMAYGAWKEYQAMPKPATGSTTPPSSSAAPMSAPPPPPASTPPPSTPPDSTPPA